MPGNIYLIPIYIIELFGLGKKSFTVIGMGNIDHGDHPLPDRFAKQVGHTIFRYDIPNYTEGSVWAVIIITMPDHNITFAVFINRIQI